jgi:alkanesulfonate monooxygenase SsuD/methylene tetrahydromethanopterin reductase-like flavin-dependent oxidoreductase (luciferase family)
VAEGATIRFIWRTHYVAATLGPVAAEVVAMLADQGFEVIAFDESEDRWNDPFTVLAHALGRTP